MHSGSRGQKICPASPLKTRWGALRTKSNRHRHRSSTSTKSLQIPCFFVDFPARCSKIPCSVAQGISLEAADFLIKYRVGIGTRKPESAKFPANSLLAGNCGVETGSYVTAHTTIQSSQPARFRRDAK
jgi:hypothetical protein